MKIGLVLTAVQGQPVEGFPFASTLELLNNRQRPLKLSFRSGARPLVPAGSPSMAESPAGNAERTPSPRSPAQLDTAGTAVAVEAAATAGQAGLSLEAASPGAADRCTATHSEPDEFGFVTDDSYDDDGGTPRTIRQREMELKWTEAKYLFNEKSAKKGIQYMANAGLIDYTAEAVAALFHQGEELNLDKKQIGEFLGSHGSIGSMPDKVRHCYVASLDLRDISFVTTLRSFLSGFRLPGESMLIERIMSTFAGRFFEENPSYCNHLTDDKVAEYKAAYVDFLCSNSDDGNSNGGEDETVAMHLLGSLIKSLPSDFKYTKDAEIIEIMAVTQNELLHVADVLEMHPPTDEEMARTVNSLALAASAKSLQGIATMARSKADTAAIAAEKTAVAAAESQESERLELGLAARDMTHEHEAAEQAARQAELDAAAQQSLFEAEAPGFRIDFALFLAVVARKLGKDSMFVLAYLAIDEADILLTLSLHHY